MNQDLISIIVPLYNKEKNIERTICSVQNQSYVNWELIIVDDGSTDASASKVHLYLSDDRIKYFKKNNGGVSSARNLGIKKAKGQWIVFLDADDYFYPEALKKLIQLVYTFHTSISTANFIVKKGKLEWLYCMGKQEMIITNNYRAWFFRTFFPRTGAALFHSSILKEHLFDESLNRFEDAKSLFDIFRFNKIAYSPIPVMVYSLDNTGLSHRANDVRKDFIFSINIENKCFWEKIVLCELLIEGQFLYPEYKDVLNLKYGQSLYLKYIAKFLILYRRIYNRLKSCL